MLAATNVAVAVAFSLLGQGDLAAVAQLGGAGIVNAALSVILAIGSFHVLGNLFGIMTVFQLLELANGVRYGLAASVFSENTGRALKVAARLDFGTVWVNEHLFPLASEMPHGGFKESGYGKDMSLYSMEEYTRIKHVAVKLA